MFLDHGKKIIRDREYRIMRHRFRKIALISKKVKTSDDPDTASSR
jgi:hypothetical protein